MFYSLLLSSFALFALGSLRAGGGHALPTVLVGLVGFLVIGPYAYLAGAIALDFGGQHGSATSSGIIDGVGYLGGILALRVVRSLQRVFQLRNRLAEVRCAAFGFENLEDRHTARL